MEKSWKWPLLAELSVNQKQTWEEYLDILVNGPISKTDGSIALLSIGDIDNFLLKELSLTLEKLSKDRKFLITKNIREATKSSNII